MSITTLSRKRLAVLATGAVALATVGLAASAHAGTDSPAATASTSGPEIHFWTLGEAKAGATIDVFAECGQQERHRRHHRRGGRGRQDHPHPAGRGSLPHR